MEPQILSISQLLVNHENPRFEPVKNQSEAIDKMLTGAAGDEVLKLATDIVQSKVNPTRNLMVVKVGGKYLVLDGNRRVTALKLLHKPGLTKNTRLKEKFTELGRNALAEIQEEVLCIVFPDRESANHWIKLEHTGKNKGAGVVGWDRVQKKRFLAQSVGEKLSRSVQLIDYAEKNGIKCDRVDSSTLDRLLPNKAIRELIGVDFPDGVLTGVMSHEQILDNVRKVFAAMSHDDFKVGDVYNVVKAKAWIEGILGISPEAEEKSKDAKTQKTETGTETTTKTKTKTKPGPLDGNWITGLLFKAYALDNRVKTILGELSSLKPANKPNVCATSLRVLLELAVYVFLEGKGCIKDMIDLEKNRRTDGLKKGKNVSPLDKDWSPSFHMMLSYMSSDESLVTDPLARKALKTYIGKKTSEPFLAELNQFTHNPNYSATQETVTEIWDKLGKLVFKAILAGQNADTN